jgi:hypothetical protein
VSAPAGPHRAPPAAAGLIRGVHGPPRRGLVVSAPPAPGSGVHGPAGPDPGAPGPAGPDPASPAAAGGVHGPPGRGPVVSAASGPDSARPAAAGLIRGVHGPPRRGPVLSAPPALGSGGHGPGPTAFGGHGPAGPGSAVSAPDGPAPEVSGPEPARPHLAWLRRTRRGNSAWGAGPAGPPLLSGVPAPPGIAVLTGGLAGTWPGTGACSRRCRPVGGTTAEPPTAGGPGLVLPRDRDPPGPGRMYRRTRSKSRSRISRTPSDRVPGCQGMTKLRERHLPLPTVTGYGSRTVTE